MTIFITGDIHGTHDIWKLSEFSEGRGAELTKADYLIIAGDFGLLWYPEGSEGDKKDAKWREWLNDQPWTTLFVDGNHENFQRLNSYRVNKWHGGKIHMVEDSVYHLMRGQVFDIDGKKFFTLGGAYSRDKQWRTEGLSWWPEEVPSHEERNEALMNLDTNDWKIDYVVTHDAPVSIAKRLIEHKWDRNTDEYEEWLQTEIANKLDFKHWFFGHHHTDCGIDDKGKYQALYYDIVSVDDMSNEIVTWWCC